MSLILLLATVAPMFCYLFITKDILANSQKAISISDSV